MTCLTCEENYIGQRGTILGDSVRVHKQQIKDPTIRIRLVTDILNHKAIVDFFRFTK